MPRIEDKLIKPSKFVKTKYRAWTFLDEELEQAVHKKQKITDKSKIKKKETPSDDNMELTQLSPVRPSDIAENKEQSSNEKKNHITIAVQSPIQSLTEDFTPDSFSMLTGLQRKITLYLYELCKSERKDVTMPLTSNQIAHICGASIATIQKSIQRLEKKNVIQRVHFKVGRGGWTRYRILTHIFQEILQLESHNQLLNNLGQTGVIYKSKLSQSDVLSYKNEYQQIDNELDTTIIERADEDVADDFDEWSLINCKPLEDIKFGEAQLKQLKKAGKLLPNEVQESIYAFAFARKQPEIVNAIRTDHLNYIMGVLKKQGEVYLPPPGYISPKELALQNELERRKKIAETEKQLFEYQFDEWYEALSDDEQKELLLQEATDEQKEHFFNNRHIPMHVQENIKKTILKPYFKVYFHKQKSGQGFVDL